MLTTALPADEPAAATITEDTKKNSTAIANATAAAAAGAAFATQVSQEANKVVSETAENEAARTKAEAARIKAEAEAEATAAAAAEAQAKAARIEKEAQARLISRRNISKLKVMTRMVVFLHRSRKALAARTERVAAFEKEKHEYGPGTLIFRILALEIDFMDTANSGKTLLYRISALENAVCVEHAGSGSMMVRLQGLEQHARTRA
jgi:hypothetical protein